ncbi:lymphocyte function-associated antigen 3-like [Micropterus salmoides]|uniref:lymphocyte function-associated antigen 3-like n=1 Tax=Micropterus salmoides TaxID=27706 RepID=UPI0018ECC3A5|nr:lymphocyte function-associated antigen 3-like [Micropterus salmoides]
MGEQVGVWLRAAVLATVLISVLAEDKYFAVGGNLELRPQPSAAITNILWKHNNNLLAEWVQGAINLTYYSTFKGRTTLDTTTGRLEIKKMVEADAGQYVVEINSHVQSPSYNVKVIKEVPKPEVVLRPVSCNGDSEECTLSCDGDTAGAEPVTYSWKEGAGDWKESEKDMKITRSSKNQVETFSCKMKNPVSEKESDPLGNPFYSAAAESSSAGTIAISVIFALIIIIAIAVVFVLIKKGVIPKFWIANDREQVPTAIPSGNGDAASNVKNSPDAL